MVTLVLDALLGICGYWPVFFVDGFNVSLQISITAKLLATYGALIFPDFIMNNLHMMSKGILETTHVITLFTLDVLNFFMDTLCVLTQMLPFTSSKFTQGALVVSFFLMH